MAEFNIVARLQVQLNSGGVTAAISQLQQQLRNANLNLGVGLNQAALGGVNALNSSLRDTSVAAKAVSSSMRGTSSAIDDSTTAMERFSGQAGLASRRFLAFILGAGAILKLAQALRQGIGEAIEFDAAMVKISQVTGASRTELAAIEAQVTSLSTKFGVASKELGEASLIFVQAGIRGQELQKILETLALTSLSPNFGSMKETGEGAIAIMQQFKQTADQARESLGAMSAVAGAFAVESKDLITAVRKSGGAFHLAGGDINQFMALFTAARATTRESAEEIATGLRTIFTRLQRPQTVENLRELGVQLRYTSDEAKKLGNAGLENQFVGSYEAIRRVSEALKGLPATDARFISVIENLGGYRQISRVIPLLQEQETMNKALVAAQGGSLTLVAEADKSQESLARSLSKVNQEFLALTRNLVESPGFQKFFHLSLDLASGLIQIADAAKPLIPILAALAAVKIGQSLSGIVSGFVGHFTGSAAGSFNPNQNVPAKPRFAKGGYIPGSGSADNVDIHATPGEFMVRKGSTQKIDRKYPGLLKAMNEGGDAALDKFAMGGDTPHTPSSANEDFEVRAKYARRKKKTEPERFQEQWEANHELADIFSDEAIAKQNRKTGFAAGGETGAKHPASSRGASFQRLRRVAKGGDDFQFGNVSGEDLVRRHQEFVASIVATNQEKAIKDQDWESHKNKWLEIDKKNLATETNPKLIEMYSRSVRRNEIVPATDYSVTGPFHKNISYFKKELKDQFGIQAPIEKLITGLAPNKSSDYDLGAFYNHSGLVTIKPSRETKEGTLLTKVHEVLGHGLDSALSPDRNRFSSDIPGTVEHDIAREAITIPGIRGDIHGGYEKGSILREGFARAVEKSFARRLGDKQGDKRTGEFLDNVFSFAAGKLKSPKLPTSHFRRGMVEDQSESYQKELTGFIGPPVAGLEYHASGGELRRMTMGGMPQDGFETGHVENYAFGGNAASKFPDAKFHSYKEISPFTYNVLPRRRFSEGDEVAPLNQTTVKIGGKNVKLSTSDDYSQILIGGMKVRRESLAEMGISLPKSQEPRKRFAGGSEDYIPFDEASPERQAAIRAGTALEKKPTLKGKKALSDVRVATDPTAPLQVIGYDVKGRRQNFYTEEHRAKADSEKFARVKELQYKIPTIEEKLRETIEAGGPGAEEASVLLLMRRTGFRVGSERDTKTKHEALGATTLTNKNVIEQKRGIGFAFTGKKGVEIRQDLEDEEVANIIRSRVSGKRKKKLFNTDEEKVRAHLHEVAGADSTGTPFHPKDLRTLVAAETAVLHLNQIPPSKKEQARVAKLVAAKLGNTPEVAKKSYIPPEVWEGKWLENVYAAGGYAGVTPKLPTPAAIHPAPFPKGPKPLLLKSPHFRPEHMGKFATGGDEGLEELPPGQRETFRHIYPQAQNYIEEKLGWIAKLPDTEKYSQLKHRGEETAKHFQRLSFSTLRRQEVLSRIPADSTLAGIGAFGIALKTKHGDVIRLQADTAPDLAQKYNKALDKKPFEPQDYSVNRPPVEEVLQSTANKVVTRHGRTTVMERLPLVKPLDEFDYEKSHWHEQQAIAQLEPRLHDKGYTLRDKHAGNIGIKNDGSYVVLDPGAVDKLPLKPERKTPSPSSQAPTVQYNRFASGGWVVPGEGNTDSYRADLEPGSYVIRKSSAARIGPSNILKMAHGGGVVPALLMPGEVVIPPNKARQIGRYALTEMNLHGRIPYAAGGFVRMAGGDLVRSTVKVGDLPENRSEQLYRSVPNAAVGSLHNLEVEIERFGTTVVRVIGFVKSSIEQMKIAKLEPEPVGVVKKVKPLGQEQSFVADLKARAIEVQKKRSDISPETLEKNLAKIEKKFSGSEEEVLQKFASYKANDRQLAGIVRAKNPRDKEAGKQEVESDIITSVLATAQSPKYKAGATPEERGKILNNGVNTFLRANLEAEQGFSGTQSADAAKRTRLYSNRIDRYVTGGATPEEATKKALREKATIEVVTDEIKPLRKQLKSGAITQEEFETGKAALVGANAEKIEQRFQTKLQKFQEISSEFKGPAFENAKAIVFGGAPKVGKRELRGQEENLPAAVGYLPGEPTLRPTLASIGEVVNDIYGRPQNKSTDSPLDRKAMIEDLKNELTPRQRKEKGFNLKADDETLAGYHVKLLAERAGVTVPDVAAKEERTQRKGILYSPKTSPTNVVTLSPRGTIIPSPPDEISSGGVSVSAAPADVTAGLNFRELQRVVKERQIKIPKGTPKDAKNLREAIKADEQKRVVAGGAPNPIASSAQAVAPAVTAPVNLLGHTSLPEPTSLPPSPLKVFQGIVTAKFPEKLNAGTATPKQQKYLNEFLGQHAEELSSSGQRDVVSRMLDKLRDTKKEPQLPSLASSQALWASVSGPSASPPIIPQASLPSLSQPGTSPSISQFVGPPKLPTLASSQALWASITNSTPTPTPPASSAQSITALMAQANVASQRQNVVAQRLQKRGIQVTPEIVNKIVASQGDGFDSLQYKQQQKESPEEQSRALIGGLKLLYGSKTDKFGVESQSQFDLAPLEEIHGKLSRSETLSAREYKTLRKEGIKKPTAEGVDDLLDAKVAKDEAARSATLEGLRTKVSGEQFEVLRQENYRISSGRSRKPPVYGPPRPDDFPLPQDDLKSGGQRRLVDYYKTLETTTEQVGDDGQVVRRADPYLARRLVKKARTELQPGELSEFINSTAKLHPHFAAIDNAYASPLAIRDPSSPLGVNGLPVGLKGGVLFDRAKSQVDEALLKSGPVSQKTLSGLTEDSINSNQKRLSKELVVAQEKWLKAIYPTISTYEKHQLALEHVNSALAGQANVIRDYKGKLLGVETAITGPEHLDKTITSPGFIQRTFPTLSKIPSGISEAASQVGGWVGDRLDDAKQSRFFDNRVARGTGRALSGVGSFLTSYPALFGAPLIGAALEHVGGTAENSVARGVGRTIREADSGSFSDNHPLLSIVPGSESVARAFSTATSGVDSFRASRGASGFLSGAITGAVAGSITGTPLGAGIGAVVGGLNGLVGSLSDASNEIREVKIGQAMSIISDRLQIIGNAPIRTTASGRVTNEDSTVRSAQADTLRELETARTNNLEENVSKSGGFFRGLGAHLGLSSPLDVAGFASLQESSSRQQINQVLPQANTVLSRSAEVLLRNNPSFTIPQVTQKLRDDPFTGKFVTGIAQARRLPIEQYLQELGVQVQQVSNRIKGERASNEARESQEKNVNAFGRLLLAVQSAADSLTNLKQQASSLSNIFYGNVNAVQVTSGAENLSQLGRNDRGALEPLRTIAAVGGSEGQRLLQHGIAADNAARVLPGIISGVASRNSQLEPEDFIRQVRQDLARSIGPNPSSAQTTALNTIVSELHRRTAGNGGVAEILRSLHIDSTEFTHQLLNPLTGPLKEVGQKIAQELDKNAKEFSEGMAEFVRRLRVAGDSQDKVGQLQVSGARVKAEIQSEREGRRNDVGSYLPLPTLQFAFQQRQERLVGARGVAANDPEFISRRLRETTGQIATATTRQDTLFKETGGNGPAYRTATEELTRLTGRAADLQAALNHLAQSAERNAAIQEKLADIRKDQDSRLSLAERYARGDPEDLQRLDRGFRIANQAFNNPTGQRNLDNFSLEDRRNALDSLSAAGHAQLRGFVGSPNAADVHRTLLEESGGGAFQLSPDRKEEQRQLQDAVISNVDRATAAQQRIADFQFETANKFRDNLLQQNQTFFARLSQEMSGFARVALVNEEGRAGARRGELLTQGTQRDVLANSGITTDRQVESIRSNRGLVEEYFRRRTESRAVQERNREPIGQQVYNNVFSGISGNSLASQPLAEYFSGNRRGLGASTLGNLTAHLQSQGYNGTEPQRIVEAFQNILARNPERTSGNVGDNQAAIVRALNEAIRGVQAQTSASSTSALGTLGGQLRDKGINVGSLDRAFDSGNQNRFLQAVDTFDGTINKLSDLGNKIAQATAQWENVSRQLAALPQPTAIPVAPQVLPPRPPVALPPAPLPPEAFPQRLANGGSVLGFARGGRVPNAPGQVFGSGGPDSVKAMLTPDEFVVSREAAQANRGLLETINASRGGQIRPYAKGGAVYLDDGGPVEGSRFLKRDIDLLTIQQRAIYDDLTNNAGVSHRQAISRATGEVVSQSVANGPIQDLRTTPPKPVSTGNVQSGADAAENVANRIRRVGQTASPIPSSLRAEARTVGFTRGDIDYYYSFGIQNPNVKLPDLLTPTPEPTIRGNWFQRNLPTISDWSSRVAGAFSPTDNSIGRLVTRAPGARGPFSTASTSGEIVFPRPTTAIPPAAATIPGPLAQSADDIFAASFSAGAQPPEVNWRQPGLVEPTPPVATPKPVSSGSVIPEPTVPVATPRPVAAAAATSPVPVAEPRVRGFFERNLPTVRNWSSNAWSGIKEGIGVDWGRIKSVANVVRHPLSTAYNVATSPRTAYRAFTGTAPIDPGSLNIKPGLKLPGAHEQIIAEAQAAQAARSPLGRLRSWLGTSATTTPAVTGTTIDNSIPSATTSTASGATQPASSTRTRPLTGAFAGLEETELAALFPQATQPRPWWRPNLTPSRPVTPGQAGILALGFGLATNYAADRLGLNETAPGRAVVETANLATTIAAVAPTATTAGAGFSVAGALSAAPVALAAGIPIGDSLSQNRDLQAGIFGEQLGGRGSDAYSANRRALHNAITPGRWTDSFVENTQNWPRAIRGPVAPFIGLAETAAGYAGEAGTALLAPIANVAEGVGTSTIGTLRSEAETGRAIARQNESHLIRERLEEQSEAAMSRLRTVQNRMTASLETARRNLIPVSEPFPGWPHDVDSALNPNPNNEELYRGITVGRVLENNEIIRWRQPIASSAEGQALSRLKDQAGNFDSIFENNGDVRELRDFADNPPYEVKDDENVVSLRERRGELETLLGEVRRVRSRFNSGPELQITARTRPEIRSQIRGEIARWQAETSYKNLFEQVANTTPMAEQRIIGLGRYVNDSGDGPRDDFMARTGLQVERQDLLTVNPSQAQGIKDYIDTLRNLQAQIITTNIGNGDLSNLPAGHRQILETVNPQQQLAMGGMSYLAEKARGGFEPQGTDTIPAMLSKGEFVVNADATKNNLAILEQINRGGGRPLYKEDGGPISSSTAPIISPANSLFAASEGTAKDNLDKLPQEDRFLLMQTLSAVGKTHAEGTFKDTNARLSGLEKGLTGREASSANISDDRHVFAKLVADNANVGNNHAEKMSRSQVDLQKKFFLQLGGTQERFLDKFGTIFNVGSNRPSIAGGRASNNTSSKKLFGTGGVVQYYATGGEAAMFQPRGSDTIPAMLSPGEFIVNASSTRHNLDLLHKINRTRGPVYLANGGLVGGVAYYDNGGHVLAALGFDRTGDDIPDADLATWARENNRSNDVIQPAIPRPVDAHELLVGPPRRLGEQGAVEGVVPPLAVPGQPNAPAQLPAPVAPLVRRAGRPAGFGAEIPEEAFPERLPQPVPVAAAPEQPVAPGAVAPRRRATLAERPLHIGLGIAGAEGVFNAPTPDERRFLQDQAIIDNETRLQVASNPFGATANFVRGQEARQQFSVALGRLNARMREIRGPNNNWAPELIEPQRLREWHGLNAHLTQITQAGGVDEARSRFVGQATSRLSQQATIQNLQQRQNLANAQNPFAVFGQARPGIEGQRQSDIHVLEQRQAWNANVAQNDFDGKRFLEAQNHRLSNLPQVGQRQPGQPIGLNVATPRGFVDGGPVFGSGNTDNVHALLKPGEFVLRREATENIGVNNLRHMNQGGLIGDAKYLASGGLAQEQSGQTQQGGAASLGINPEVAQAFSKFADTAQMLNSGFNQFGGVAEQMVSAFSIFGDNASKLAEALHNFPGTINVQGHQTVELILNGAEVLASMRGDLQTLVEDNVKKVIRDRLGGILSDAAVQLE